MRYRRWLVIAVLLTLGSLYLIAVLRISPRVEYYYEDNHIPRNVFTVSNLNLSSQPKLSYHSEINKTITVPTKITSIRPIATTLAQRKNIGRKTIYPLTIDSPYLINNPGICKDVKNLTFIVIVHTAPDHAERRRSMRETWANKNFFKNISLRIVFLLGKPSSPKAQFALENENLIYRDIVQGNFMDSYRNLTHKGVLGFRWISENCNDAKMVIKVDDDVFVDIFKVYLEIFPKYHNKSRYILCHVRHKNTSPIVRAKDVLKWKVHEDEFRGFRYYPTTYCNGYAVFLAPDLIQAMYQASYSTPFFWIDDVYLYGLLPSKLSKVNYHSLVNDFTLNEISSLKCYSDNKSCHYLVGNAWRNGAMHKMWLASLAKLDKQIRPFVNVQINEVVLGKALNEINKEVYKMFPPPKKTVAKAPPKKADAKAPPKKADAKAPPKKADAKAPPKKADANSPPKKADANSPPKKADANSPPKKADANSPPKKVDANSPPKKVDANSPPKKVIAIIKTTAKT